MYELITANRNYSSWSLRPWVLMTALGIAFRDRIEPFTKPANYDDFRSFSPTGQVPALLHEGRTIYDSLGITLYLADRHEGVWPTDPDARAWAQCAACEMHSGFAALRNDCTMNVGVRVTPKPMSDALQSQCRADPRIVRGGAGEIRRPVARGRAISPRSTPSSPRSPSASAPMASTSAPGRRGSTISSRTPRCWSGNDRRSPKAGARSGMRKNCARAGRLRRIIGRVATVAPAKAGSRAITQRRGLSGQRPRLREATINRPTPRAPPQSPLRAAPSTRPSASPDRAQRRSRS